MTTTPLDQIASAYAALVARSHPLTVPGDIAGTPEPATLTEVAVILHDRASSPQGRDRIWAHIVNKTRHGSHEWTIVAAGLALPGLRRAAARVARIWPHDDPAETDAEIVAAFVTALADIDVSRPRVCSRLLQVAFSAGRSQARRHIHNTHIEQKVWTSRMPPPPAGHVDLVLAQAVHDGVIDAGDAELIASTRIEHTPLTTLAKENGTTVGELQEQRKAAETALVTWMVGCDA